MNEVQRLYELQLLDMEIDAQRERLVTIEARLGEKEDLLRAQQEFESLRHQETEIEKRRKELEWERANLVEKIAVLEQKLYGGSIKSPKELLTIQQDDEILSKKKAVLEDQEIELMIVLEELQRRLIREKGELRKTEQAWEKEQADLEKDRGELLSQLGALEDQRESLKGQIDAPAVQSYEDIRQRLRLAVAKVEIGMCQGCRIALSTTELQRARASLVLCQSCGRILFAP